MFAGLGVGVGEAPDPPHGVSGDVKLRGFGSVIEKSLALLSVSVQPPLIRVIDLFAGGAGAGVPSEQVAAP